MTRPRWRAGRRGPRLVLQPERRRVRRCDSNPEGGRNRWISVASSVSVCGMKIAAADTSQSVSTRRYTVSLGMPTNWIDSKLLLCTFSDLSGVGQGA